MAVNLQQPYGDWSLLEAVFAALVLIFAIDDRRVAIGFVIALASLNRETALFLVILYAAAAGLSKRTVVTTAVYLGIYAAIFIGLRFWRGFLPAVHSWSEVLATWAITTKPFYVALGVVNNFLFLGAFWVFAVLGFRRAPAFVRRSALMIPPYVATLVLTYWYETRPDMTMYPILLPLALSFLFTPRQVPLTGADLKRLSS